MIHTRCVAFSVVALCLLTIFLHAQGPGQGTSLLAVFRQAGIAEAPGPITVFYVETEKERALGLQKSLQAGRDWYKEQLDVAPPVVMTVFDAATYDKFKLTNPTARALPPRNGDPAIVQMPGLDGVDPSGSPLGRLQGEQVLFHEYGHVLADSLDIGSRSWVLNELFANIFGGAYLLSERPDLYAFLVSRRASRTAPQYTALIDLDYLGAARTDPASVGWMQLQGWSMGFALAQSERLSDLVPRLQKEFPESSARLELGEALITRLNRISPGLASSFAAVYPSTTPAKPVACDSAMPLSDRSGKLIIANTTANPITMNPINDPKGTITLTIPANEFRSLTRSAGLILKISDGSCYVLREETTIATIGGR